ncbi:Transposase (putative), YhgA-like protein [Candidatus Magnetomorum sp. HK-1]|nr:Transposase (putative), YhgA-like protein [Candidatus Magnetomorum sp. HK-1]
MIWDESLKQVENQKGLNPILPIVLFIGNSSWNYSTEFFDLVNESPLDSEFVPKFKHFLLDHSDKSKKVKGALKARIAHLLIQANFQQHLKEISHILCDLMAQLPQGPGIDYRRVFKIYIAATQDRNKLLEFLAMIRQKPLKKEGGDDMLCAIDEWKLEGRIEGEKRGEKKGRIEGTISIIDNMQKLGMDWSIIANATGVSQQKYEAMQVEYQLLVDPPPVHDTSARASL